LILGAELESDMALLSHKINISNPLMEEKIKKLLNVVGGRLPVDR